MNKLLQQEIEDFKNELVEIRRKFHQIPELGFEEYETSALINDYLKNWGIETKRNVGETGVTALIKGKGEGKTIAIRADIDALPIEEKTDLGFASKNKGKMHACGHDSHITIALGTAKVLSKYKDRLNGNIKFIFQPAEEILSGAKAMIEDGVLKDPEVDAIIGLHNWPELNSGEIGIKTGSIMAAADKFEVVIKGVGGHGALPHKTVDPIVVSAEIINALQRIISREIDPQETAVISIGTLNSGTAFNIIPDELKFSGTVRTFDDNIRKYIARRMEEIISAACQGAGCDFDFDYHFGIPATVNDEKFTQRVIKVLREKLRDTKIVEPVTPSMGGEDFSLFLNKVPGTYFFLGTGNEEKGIIHSIHHPKYIIDEDILPIGVKAFSEIVLNYLS